LAVLMQARRLQFLDVGAPPAGRARRRVRPGPRPARCPTRCTQVETNTRGSAGPERYSPGNRASDNLVLGYATRPSSPRRARVLMVANAPRHSETPSSRIRSGGSFPPAVLASPRSPFTICAIPAATVALFAGVPQRRQRAPWPRLKADHPRSLQPCRGVDASRGRRGDREVPPDSVGDRMTVVARLGPAHGRHGMRRRRRVVPD
jgi:hypothetical protein